MIRNIGKIALGLIGISVLVIAIFLILERPPSAAGIEPEQLLKRGWASYREVDAIGSMEVSIYRNGKLAKREELPSPLLPHLREGLGNERAGKKFEFLNFLINRDRFGSEFLSTHDINVVGSDKIAGRWAWELEIKPVNDGSGYISVAIDHETGFPLRRIKYDRNGEKENQLQFTEIDHFEKKRMPGPMGGPMGGGPNRPDQMQPGQPGEGRMRPETPLAKRGPGFGGGRQNPDDGFRGPPQGGGPGMGGPFGAIPKPEFEKLLRDGKAMFPTYLPEGYKSIVARKPGPPGTGPAEKIQLIFSDGVNAMSIFQIKLPVEHLTGGDIERILEEKTRQLHNSFPEGFALRRTDSGLLVGVGDIDPEILGRVLDSMDYVKDGVGAYPYEDIPEDDEELL